jgi:hypothetical protein
MAAPPTITVYDTVYDNNGKPLVSATVTCVLESTLETYAGGLITARTQQTLTDPTGRFQFTVICNDLLAPANSAYTITIPSIGRSYQIAPQSANGSSQQTTAANVIVNTPSPLTPATSNLTGPLTVAGLLTAQAGLAVTGSTAISGNLSVGGVFTPAAIAVNAGETGIDTTAAGALLIGDNTATSIELGAATTVMGTLNGTALVTAQAGLTVVGAVILPIASIADEALSENIAILNEANVFSLGQTMLGSSIGAGTLGYSPITANQAGIVNAGNITGLSVAVTVGTGRRIVVIAKVLYTKHTAGLLTLNLMEGATQLDQWVQTAADTFLYTATLMTWLTPTVGAHTYFLQVGVGAGTADVTANTGVPAYIGVMDVGT